VEVLSRVATYFGEMIAAFLPHRHWARLPASFAMKSSVVVSGALTIFAGAAVGIPGFLEHAAEMSSLGTSAVIANAEHGREVARSPGFAGLSLFTFQGRLRTLYPLTEHRDLEVVRKSVRYDLARRIDVQIP
jgi:hypothetical protein